VAGVATAAANDTRAMKSNRIPCLEDRFVIYCFSFLSFWSRRS
jgi:hypothetical protein